MPNKVYFANELGFDQDLYRPIIDRFKKTFEASGAYVHEPFAETDQSGILKDFDPKKGLTPQQSFDIAQFDRKHVESSDIIFAFANGGVPDTGTLIEVGLAIAHGLKTGHKKEIFIYRGDFRTASSAEGIFIGPALMMACENADEIKERVFTSIKAVEKSDFLKQKLFIRPHSKKEETHLRPIPTSAQGKILLVDDYHVLGKEIPQEHTDTIQGIESIMKDQGYEVTRLDKDFYQATPGNLQAYFDDAQKLAETLQNVEHVFIQGDGTSPRPENMLLLGVAAGLDLKVHFMRRTQEHAGDGHYPINLMLGAAYPEGPEAWEKYFYNSMEALTDPEKGLLQDAPNSAKPTPQDATPYRNTVAATKSNDLGLQLDTL